MARNKQVVKQVEVLSGVISDEVVAAKAEKAEVKATGIKCKMVSPYIYIDGVRHEAKEGVYFFSQEQIDKLTSLGHKVEIVK